MFLLTKTDTNGTKNYLHVSTPDEEAALNRGNFYHWVDASKATNHLASFTSFHFARIVAKKAKCQIAKTTLDLPFKLKRINYADIIQIPCD